MRPGMLFSSLCGAKHISESKKRMEQDDQQSRAHMEEERQGGCQKVAGGGQLCRYFQSQMGTQPAVGMWMEGRLLSLLLRGPSVPLELSSSPSAPAIPRHQLRAPGSRVSGKGKIQGKMCRRHDVQMTSRRVSGELHTHRAELSRDQKSLWKRCISQTANQVSDTLAESESSIKEDVSNKNTNISKT